MVKKPIILTVDVTVFAFVTRAKTIARQCVVMIHTTAADKTEIRSCSAPENQVEESFFRNTFFFKLLTNLHSLP